MDGSFPLSARLYGLTNAGTAVTFDTEPVDPGELWEVQSLSANNQSGESVTVSFSVVTSSEVIQLAPLATVATGDAVGPYLTPLLIEGQKIRATFKGTAMTGPVYALVTAWRVPYPPSAAPVTPLAAGEAQEV
jgi:hypothetical protein